MDALWDQMCKRMVEVIGQGLKGSSEGEVFLGCKTEILLFVQTLEVSRLCQEPYSRRLAKQQDYAYNVTELNTLLTTLFERYSDLLRRKFSTDFDQVSCDKAGLPP